MGILHILYFLLFQRVKPGMGTWWKGVRQCRLARVATLKTRRGGDGSEIQARSPAASNMSSLASMSSFGWVLAADWSFYWLLYNLAAGIGNPGHRDLGLVGEGHLQQPEQAHQHRPRPCLHLHMGWRYHLHNWSVPFAIFILMLWIGWEVWLMYDCLQDSQDVWEPWGRTPPCWPPTPSFSPSSSCSRCNKVFAFAQQYFIMENHSFSSIESILSCSNHPQMTCGILGFIFKDWIKSQATSGFQAFIVHYRYAHDKILILQPTCLNCNCVAETTRTSKTWSTGSRRVGSSAAASRDQRSLPPPS